MGWLSGVDGWSKMRAHIMPDSSGGFVVCVRSGVQICQERDEALFVLSFSCGPEPLKPKSITIIDPDLE